MKLEINRQFVHLVPPVSMLKIDIKGIDNEALKKTILERKGCFFTQERPEDVKLDEVTAEMRAIQELAKRAISETMSIDYDKLVIYTEGKKENHWAQCRDKLEQVTFHDHPGSVASAVYYVQVDEGSSPLFMYPDGIPRMSDLRDCVYCHEPEEGELIIFPAWIPHHTVPHHAETERIAYVFNIDHVKE